MLHRHLIEKSEQVHMQFTCI